MEVLVQFYCSFITFVLRKDEQAQNRKAVQGVKSFLSNCFDNLRLFPVYNYGASKRIVVPQKAGTAKYKETSCLVWQ